MVVGLNTFYTRSVPNGTVGTGFTQAFTTVTAEVIVVKMVTETSTSVGTAPTATGLTFTARTTSAVASNVWAGIWTAPASAATSYTLSYGATSAVAGRSVVIERWTGVTLAATPAVANTQGSGAPSTTLTTTAANSAVSWLNGDWSAIIGARTYRTTSAVPVEEFTEQSLPGVYVPDFAYQLAPVAGSQTLGLTAPTGQKWTLLGIELPATSGLVAPSPRRLSRWR